MIVKGILAKDGRFVDLVIEKTLDGKTVELQKQKFNSDELDKVLSPLVDQCLESASTAAAKMKLLKENEPLGSREVKVDWIQAKDKKGSTELVKISGLVGKIGEFAQTKFGIKDIMKQVDKPMQEVSSKLAHGQKVVGKEEISISIRPAKAGLLVFEYTFLQDIKLQQSLNELLAATLFGHQSRDAVIGKFINFAEREKSGSDEVREDAAILTFYDGVVKCCGPDPKEILKYFTIPLADLGLEKDLIVKIAQRIVRLRPPAL